MRITEEAQGLLKEALKENSADALYVQIEKSCCGESLSFALAMKEEDDTIMMIDNIPVIMDLVALKRAEEVTIIVQNGQLFVEDKTESTSSCESGCAGCESHA
jgi:Fe-S cluster assembly iron-binding protein IscA